MRRNYKKAEALLASEDPLWFCLVDVDWLDMSDVAYCVFGQVERKLGRERLPNTVDDYGNFVRRHDISNDEAVIMGINAGWIKGEESYVGLDDPQRRWKRRIRQLQAAHNCADKESAAPAGGAADDKGD